MTDAAKTGKAMIARGREAALCLDHALKALMMYPSSSPVPEDARRRLLTSLTRAAEEFGGLTLEVRGAELFCGGESVHRGLPGPGGLAGALESDGLRSLTFSPGVTADELSALLDALARRVRDRAGEENLGVALWNAGLAHVSCETVGELDEGDAAAREGAFWSRAAGSGAGGRAQAGAAAAGSGSEGADESGSAGGAPGAAADSMEAARALSRLAELSAEDPAFASARDEAERFDPVGATLGVVQEMLAAEPDLADFEASCALLDGLYDGFAERCEFAPARRVLEAAAEAVLAEEIGPRGNRLREVRARAGGPQEVARLAAALDANPGADLSAAGLLLEALPDGALPHLVAALGVLKRATARLLVCEVLVRRGVGRVDTIGLAISDARWFVARNGAMILGRIGGAKACGYLRTALLRAEEPVRREAVKSLERLADGDALDALRFALGDAIPDLRLRALEALARGGRPADAQTVEARVRAPDFRGLDAGEQSRWLEALAALGGDGALPVFQDLIGRRRFLSWGARGRLRPLAVAALAAARGPRSSAYLVQLAGGRDAKLREPARAALAARARRGGEAA